MITLSLPILTPLVPSISATVVAASTFPCHVTQPALLQPLVDDSTVPVTEGDGADEHVEMILILLITVASTPSGSYPMDYSAAVTSAKVVYASASEDTKTTDIMDNALNCLLKTLTILLM